MRNAQPLHQIVGLLVVLTEVTVPDEDQPLIPLEIGHTLSQQPADLTPSVAGNRPGSMVWKARQGSVPAGHISTSGYGIREDAADGNSGSRGGAVCGTSGVLRAEPTGARDGTGGEIGTKRAGPSSAFSYPPQEAESIPLP